MVTWNEYMRNHPIATAIQLPRQLKSFLYMHSRQVFDNHLEDELIKHLTNMWVEGHIRREDMLENMQLYSSLVDIKRSCTGSIIDQT
jgi:hypothetical protein